MFLFSDALCWVCRCSIWSYPWSSLCVCLNSQITSLGAKLKERNSLFRKSSKVQSHEMKEVLYSNLVQANLVRAFTQKYWITTLGIFWERGRLKTFFIFPGGATDVERNDWGSRWDDEEFGWLYSWIRNRYVGTWLMNNEWTNDSDPSRRWNVCNKFSVFPVL